MNEINAETAIEPLMQSSKMMMDAPQNVLERSMQERKNARRERWRLLRKKPGFLVGMVIVL